MNEHRLLSRYCTTQHYGIPNALTIKNYRRRMRTTRSGRTLGTNAAGPKSGPVVLQEINAGGVAARLEAEADPELDGLDIEVFVAE